MGTFEYLGSVWQIKLTLQLNNPAQQDQGHHHQCTAVLWSPPRPLYHQQENVSWPTRQGYHDGAHPHVTCTVQTMLCYMYWKISSHLPRILDLPPCNSMCLAPQRN
jgi:hypothetical protein